VKPKLGKVQPHIPALLYCLCPAALLLTSVSAWSCSARPSFLAQEYLLWLLLLLLMVMMVMTAVLIAPAAW
jgi:hypothetical protein